MEINKCYECEACDSYILQTCINCNYSVHLNCFNHNDILGLSSFSTNELSLSEDKAWSCDRCKEKKKVSCCFCSLAKNPYLKKYRVDNKEMAFCHIKCAEEQHAEGEIALVSSSAFVTKTNNFGLLRRSLLKQITTSYYKEDKAFPSDLIEMFSKIKQKVDCNSISRSICLSSKYLKRRFSFYEFCNLTLDLIEQNKAYKNGSIDISSFFPEKYLNVKVVKGVELVALLKVLYEGIESTERLNFERFSFFKKSPFLDRSQIFDLD